MKMLALDCSTGHASVALLENGETVHQATWFTERARHENAIDHLTTAMNAARWAWDVIDLFAVGRGPGAYSGLRASLLTVQALAAPGSKPVVAVSSMEALGLRLMEEHETESITLVGDARRQSVWMGTLTRPEILTHAIEWRIVSAAEAASALVNARLIATPHADALQTLREQTPAASWMAESQHPTALDIARLALARRAHHAPPGPLTPLYLHSAV